MTKAELARLPTDELVDQALQLETANEELRGENTRLRARFAALEAAEIERVRTEEVRRRAEEQIQVSLREKEVLLQEIHHRARNNMQIISGLLDFQAQATGDERVRNAFRESKNRIQSMARVHKQLYRSADVAQIDMEAYVKGLGADLIASYGAHDVSLRVDAPDVAFPIDTAIPCGLLLTELISNALKHAFPDRGPGEVRVVLRAAGDRYELTVNDNGAGLPPDWELDRAESLGLGLVQTLTRQLKGTLEVNRTAGTAFEVTFAAPGQAKMAEAEIPGGRGQSASHGAMSV